MNITNVISETAIITLKSRVIEFQKEAPIINDPVSLTCLENIANHVPKETYQRIVDRKLPSTLTTHVAIRARKYDLYTKEFLEKYPDALVVSLGCGFDTRYWRVSDSKWNYIEIDLADVIAAKKEILKDKIDYLTIGCSVLDEKWIREVLAIQDKHVLFLAEGLFMYLPQKEVESLFNKLSDSFTHSCIVFETVNKKYTSGIWKKMVESKMKRSLGTDAGSSYQFGVNKAKEIESFGQNIKLVEEWSYFEDEDIEPKILWYLRNMKFFTRTQWTIKAEIG
ncbi:MAG: class I SAM-dependent methyltransferase [Anaerolineaceae bacterium]|nr:class I SAM-dependent methyltransferase [Anaerolineaceae bacterium]